MKDKIAPVKNLLNLAELGETLKDRTNRLPGIGVVVGDTGLGKSTGLTWYGVRKAKAVYTRALEVWTPSSMLRAIGTELGVTLPSSLADAIAIVVQHLGQQNRMLLIDEADYVVDKRKLLNTIRDLHDLSTMPVILVGMADFAKKLRARMDQRQFTGRVAFELEFKPLDLADTQLLAHELLDGVELDEPLMAHIHAGCEGSARLVCVALQRIETFAKKENKRVVTAKLWGDRPLHSLTAGRGE